VFSDDFAFYFVVVAIYAAYLVHDRRTLAGYLVLFSLALAAPLAYDQNHTREQLHNVLVVLPVLFISAGMVVYLREALEADRRVSRQFAEEALTLVSRIRGKPAELPLPGASEDLKTTPAPEVGPDDAGRRSRPRRRIRQPTIVFAALAGLLVLPAALAVAGVTLPDAARAPFETVGISLPNQSEETDDGDASAGASGADRATVRSRGAGASASDHGQPEKAAGAGDASGAQPGAQPTATSVAGETAEPTGAPPAPATSDPGAGDTGQSSPPSAGDGLTEVLEQSLRETLDGVGQLLQRSPPPPDDGSG
jgi:hypothetical protein